MTKTGGQFEGYTVSMLNYNENAKTVNLRITANVTGTAGDVGAGPAPAPGGTKGSVADMPWGKDPAGNPITADATAAVDRVPGVAAVYSEELSAIRIPRDPTTGMQYDIQSYKINEDGTIMGTDTQNRTIAIGQLALVAVENPNGLEKGDGYYYNIGPNAGDVEAMKPNGGPTGKIRGGYLEMANVDLANEFSNMITTQRGFQANSKIITVTDEMLQELVNMKR